MYFSNMLFHSLGASEVHTFTCVVIELTVGCFGIIANTLQK
jgi:hypothetical protein